MKKGKLVEKLMEIRKDWTSDDYNLWEENGAVDAALGDGPHWGMATFDRSIHNYRKWMKEVLTEHYKKSELEEFIEMES